MNRNPIRNRFSDSEQRRVRCSNRRGIATMWVILSLPIFVTLIIAITDVANIWLARVELKNALDAAALSGVKSLETGAAAARTAAQEAFAANTIRGAAFSLDLNAGNANPGDILLGEITTGGGPLTFQCNVAPACPNDLGVRTQKTIQISSIGSSIPGLGPYNINVESFARFQCLTSSPQLVRIETFTCP